MVQKHIRNLQYKDVCGELKTFRATFYSSSQLIIFVIYEQKVALKVFKKS